MRKHKELQQIRCMNDIICRIGEILLAKKDYRTFYRLRFSNHSVHDEFETILDTYNNDMDIFLQSVRLTLADEYYNNIAINTLPMLDQMWRKLKRKDVQIDQCIQDYYQNLTSIKLLLSQLIQESKDVSRKVSMIQYRDKIYGSILSGLDVEISSRKVTQVFDEFVKGITYFNDEEVYDQRHPVYHRRGSCSPRGQQNIPCKSGMYDETVSKEIEKCYLERLIYDAIWQELCNTQQDKGHLEWLEETRRAYLSCHPNHSIVVEFDFNSRRLSNDNVSASERNIVPTQMSVKYFDGNGVETNNEIFTKTYNSITRVYDYPVRCKKIENGRMFIKYTDFENQGSWVSLVGGEPKKTRKAK